MNFHDLRIIVNQVKKTLKCPKCNAKYTDEDIEIIGSLGDEQLFFNAWCASCEVQSVVNVQVNLEWFYGQHEGPQRLGTAPRMGHVSLNEVLDMHNFLKGFNGDFTKMFSEKAPNS